MKNILINKSDIGEVIYNIQKEIVRNMMLNEKRRPDGRAFDEIRPISCEVGILPRTHGTGLFTRGLNSSNDSCNSWSY